MNAPKPEAFETLLARTINHATSTDPEYPGLHAVKMTGVVHPQKEPRPSLTREGFAGLVGTYEAQAYDHGYCEGCASYDDEGLSGAKRTAGRAESRVKATGAALLAAFDSLAAERDEWKRRAEKVDSYTEALKLSRDEQRSRATTAEAERDAAIKRCDKLEAFITYIESPALKAWRALDAAERANTVEDLKTWADLVERGLGDGGRGSHRGLSVAADCLEALAERP